MVKPKTKLLLLAVFLLLPQIAGAAGLVPCGGVGENPCTVQDFFIMMAKVINILLALAGMYAVFQIIGAGFWLAVSDGNEEAITKQRSTITNAVVGFALALMGFMLVNTVVNILLMSKCKVDLRNPLTYVTITDPNNIARCPKK